MKYEYFPLTNDVTLDHHALNTLGEQGWELVMVQFGGRPERWHYVFKRQKVLKLK